MKIVEIAIKMEEDAIRFYTDASKKTSHPAGKQMFLSVADDEKRHLNMLSRIFKGEDAVIVNVNPKDSIKTVFETMKD